MSSRIDQQQLESYLWGAATLLRGTIDAGDYKQFIFPLLFFKRLCDVYEEEYEKALKESGGDVDFATFAENHRFQVPPGAHWRDVRNRPKTVGKGIQDAMRDIEKANPDTLFGIFGDAQWTNTERLPDNMLKDLLEHFSTVTLSIANVPGDELGNAYEFLIKKFADDSGHTAAEFYTNRTLVRLMALMLDPQPGESIYDPTGGTGGMLLSCIEAVKRRGKEWRTLKIYGQELNLMTSSIARMNMFLHGIEDFKIVRGDTLSAPAFTDGDTLRQFDVVLANPPYSIKQWDRTAWSSDRFGRNLLGTPPQGRADYAFFGHILASLKPKTGRCAILFPHGVLFRDEEKEMRAKLVDMDQVECVLGLGPNLFYNSPMEACVVVCRTAKPKMLRNKILFINAVNEVTRERAQSFLEEEHIQRILTAYQGFEYIPDFARAVPLNEIRANQSNLNIALYVRPKGNGQGSTAGTTAKPLAKVIQEWQESSARLRASMKTLLQTLERI
jgi:type I restriction enzyme M protein